MDAKTINGTYGVLLEAKVSFFNAEELVIKAKIELENERTKAIATGEIVGKNPDEREAKAQEILWPCYEALRAAEAKERKFKLALDVAALEVERVRLLVRAEELAAADRTWGN